jgi:putative transposase
LLGYAGAPPERITTDKLGSYAAAIRRLPELSDVDHQEVRAALRCNNRVEQAHQPTRIRERRMGRFRCPTSAQRFLSVFARVSNLFRPGRHRLKAHEWRSALQGSFSTWQNVVGISVS